MKEVSFLQLLQPFQVCFTPSFEHLLKDNSSCKSEKFVAIFCSFAAHTVFFSLFEFLLVFIVFSSVGCFSESNFFHEIDETELLSLQFWSKPWIVFFTVYVETNGKLDLVKSFYHGLVCFFHLTNGRFSMESCLFTTF